jgi:hypothetical protein
VWLSRGCRSTGREQRRRESFYRNKKNQVILNERAKKKNGKNKIKMGVESGTDLRLALPSSTYLVRISANPLMSWLNDSRSITRQLTPSGSSAMMLAVLMSSLRYYDYDDDSNNNKRRKKKKQVIIYGLLLSLGI